MDEIFYFLRQEDLDLSEYEFSHKEIAGEYKREFASLSKRVFNSCLIYFELKEITGYINEFKNGYENLVKDNKGHLIDLVGSDVYMDERNLITHFYKESLYPFRAFGSNDVKHLTGLDYLESILGSTSRIVKTLGKIPSKESEVYNAVKIVIESTFPKDGAQFIGGYEPFYKDAKCYKPDILVPSLNCAIEYKFAESLKELNDTIDQILVDVKGYSGHVIYTLFYAVFYVKVGIGSQEVYLNYWKSKGIPDYWTPIFVEGETM